MSFKRRSLCTFPFFTLTNSYAKGDETRTVKIYTKTGDKGCILTLENFINSSLQFLAIRKNKLGTCST